MSIITIFFFFNCLRCPGHRLFSAKLQLYYACNVCVCVRVRVCRCQGLDQGLVPAWIKSRWRPWQGRKPPVPTFSCSIQPSLLYFQWQDGMCDSLDLYLNAPSFTREKKRGTCQEVRRLINMHAISFHGVIIRVMGTGQSCPSNYWKRLQD